MSESMSDDEKVARERVAKAFVAAYEAGGNESGAHLFGRVEHFDALLDDLWALAEAMGATKEASAACSMRDHNIRRTHDNLQAIQKRIRGQ